MARSGVLGGVSNCVTSCVGAMSFVGDSADN